MQQNFQDIFQEYLTCKEPEHDKKNQQMPTQNDTDVGITR